ncbi:C4-dicarboxylate transport system permease small protein [Fulvimarina pelagi HTCC2506]|uniref:TRAP transporter small permease protein n=1 Tax=Fulvimarina pelagi HTCC2506 TaxID=314231 RepID=Q0G453_9HYPH|nr:C4-dicarboxylate transport system permease small protein [Fulvimarina pelagi HTCC2506]
MRTHRAVAPSEDVWRDCLSIHRGEGGSVVVSKQEGRDDGPSGLLRAVHVFWSTLDVLVVAMFIGMLVVMFVQVASRYALGIGVPWTDETSRFLFIGEIFFGAAIAQRYGAQIRITVLLDVLPDRARLALETLADILMAVIALLVAYGAVGMAQRTSSVTASTLPISFSYLYYVQATGLVLLVLLVLRDIGARIAGKRGSEARS